MENTNDYDQIHHPAVRCILKYINPGFGVSVTHDGDIPARSGIGSSSAFTVGLLHSLLTLCKHPCSKRILAEKAIYVERDLIQEIVGYQDQIASAYGGFNKIEFHKNGSFRVIPMDLSTERLEDFRQHLCLFFTGISRISSEVAREQKNRIASNESVLKQMADISLEAEEILRSNVSLEVFGKLLHESWKLKKSLSSKISNTLLDDIYNKGLASGASGGKLLGAGAGGFMLFFVAPQKRIRFLEEMRGLLHVPVDLDFSGSSIIFNDYGDN